MLRLADHLVSLVDIHVGDLRSQSPDITYVPMASLSSIPAGGSIRPASRRDRGLEIESLQGLDVGTHALLE